MAPSEEKLSPPRCLQLACQALHKWQIKEGDDREEIGTKEDEIQMIKCVRGSNRDACAGPPYEHQF